MKKIFTYFFITLIVLNYSYLSFGQEQYPQNYFRDPLNIPVQLAANFGELREDHFHMGLDIRTQGRENLPVFAAADGYISRIKIEKLGYGRAIYITHPNGFTTVYGHLNNFYDALEKYVEDKQYKDESWAQDFTLPENLFPVKKAQFIAYSGNTGGSAGPHLHFEIRDTKTGNNLNPRLFGLTIPDTKPPILYSLYWYDGRYSVYNTKPHIIPITLKNNIYKIAETIVHVGSPVISIGFRAEDLTNNSPFKFGVYHATLSVDDSLLFEYKLNDFSYDDSRYVNACMDYALWMQKNLGVQYLNILPGNKLNIFAPLESDGKILLNDTLQHRVDIVLSDEKNNITRIDFLVKYDPSLDKSLSTIYDNGYACEPDETKDIQTTNAKIHFNENSFYDALSLKVAETNSTSSKQVSPTLHIGSYLIPVNNVYDVSLKVNDDVNTTLKNHVVMQLQTGKYSYVQKGVWNDDYLNAKFSYLGNARLLLDTIAPVIVTVGWKNNETFKSANKMTIKCIDDVSRIASFRAELDGRWLMFSQKNDYFIYTFDAHCKSGNHTLTITATDVAGNEAIQTFNFTKD